MIKKGGITNHDINHKETTSWEMFNAAGPRIKEINPGQRHNPLGAIPISSEGNPAAILFRGRVNVWLNFISK
jgi:hypothetical protein